MQKKHLRVENLEDRRLLAADLTGLSPADGAANVSADANLVMTFSDPVQKGPGTGYISVFDADTNALLEVVNVNSDRVTFAGNEVTIDLVDDLAANRNYYVQVDPSAVRDTSGTVGNAVLMHEDFESLALEDSPLATDDIVTDINDYVLVMTGTLDVVEAGEYTFGVNSDDGQWLMIDVAQDGIDPENRFDDELIFDNTTHGNQDRLTVCGLDFAGQSCEGATSEDPIQLDAGEYAFEYWYFERGGGSSGEFYYAKGNQEVFDPAAFALVGDPSQGIGVTADGITATTYKSASEQIGSLDPAALDLEGGFIDSAAGFPVSAQIPTADVWNSGGPGRFPDNHSLPGFPPNQAGDNTDWTPVGPTGWTQDNTDLRVNEDGTPGTPEYAGWTFLDKHFWINQQGNQNRLAYTKGQNVVAVVDPDAYDDFIEIGPDSEPDPDGDGVRDASFFDASLSSPHIYLDGVAANSATVTFDSSWRDEDWQTAVVEVEYFDADGNSTGVNEILRWESQPGPNFHDDMENETVTLNLQNPADAASLVITWDMPAAANDWWWAIDNIVVEGDVAGAAFVGITDNEGWDFNTFAGASFDVGVNVSVAEDAGTATVSVTRQGDASVAASVQYSTSGRTASDDDYTSVSGTLDFAAGELEKSFTVAINDDDAAEADETINVFLSSPSAGAQVGNFVGTITIVDNDRSTIAFQEGVEITIDGAGTGATYAGTTDADPAGSAPDEVRDRPELNPDGETGGQPAHGLTAFMDLFGDGAGQIPDGAFIAKATLTFNITNEGTPLTVHRMLADWSEEITWNELTLNGNTDPGLQGDGIEATPSLRQFDAPAEVVDVDVTDDIRVWHSGAAENYGWGFLPTGTNGVDWDSSEAPTEGNRPKLSVEFALVDSPPAADVTAPDNEITLVNGSNDGDGNDGPPPGAEGVENAINDVTQKYLNFLDLDSGFVVKPASVSIVNGIRLYTANDAEERDPASYKLEGALDDGNFTLISEGDLALPTARNAGGDVAIDPSLNHQMITFDNLRAYTQYRVTFPTLKDAESANSMQIAEVELLGDLLTPPDGGGSSLVGDIDGDGTVGFSDFLILSANFGTSVDPNTGGDLDGDGSVAFADFLLLSNNFGQSAAAVDAALADDDLL